MHQNQKRIFVGNLPPDVSQDDVKENFSCYGNIISVEIKHRKEGTNQNSSPVFAFVNIEIDDRTLNKCFREFSEFDWNGYQVNLEVAKESFLERLKREREESNNKIQETPKKEQVILEEKQAIPVDKSLYKKTYHSSSSSDESSSESEEESKPIKPIIKQVVEKPKEELDYVIKNNKFKQINGKTLKIESVCEKPLYVIESKKKKEVKEGKALVAEEKRKKSLLLMKNTYQQQKLAIKSALSTIDSKRNNKIIFNDEGKEDTYAKKSTKRKNADYYEEYESTNVNKKNKFSLFNEDEELEGDNNINFEVRKQFEGEKGQKLLRLQNRFKNDDRFQMDSRFMDENEQEEEINDYAEEDEKQKQMEILETVLGRKILNNRPKELNNELQKSRKSMLRFDPSKPEHSKYEIKESDGPKKKKIKEKKEDEVIVIDEPKVEVSKETFYKVTGNLKQSLQEKQSFSLLSMFGTAEEKDEEQEQSNKMKDISDTKQFGTRNPFKYDSSDSEDDERKTNKKQKQKHLQNEQASDSKIETPIVHAIKNESFFFQNNDERLQEAFDFLKKLGSEVKLQPFEETRRELKKIVRDKIKNNLRNHRPFRKKLGRHKMIKVKNAKKK